MTNINELLAKAAARVKAMSPEEHAAMIEAQRKSWVRAFTTPCEHGVLDFEQCPECRKGHSSDNQWVGPSYHENKEDQP